MSVSMERENVLLYRWNGLRPVISREQGMCYDSDFASASVSALMWHGWRAIGCVAITSEGESNTVEDVNVMS